MTTSRVGLECRTEMTRVEDDAGRRTVTIEWRGAQYGVDEFRRFR